MQQRELLAIYILDQLALQAKESCPSQSPSAIQRYPSLNKVVVGLRVFFDPESVVGNLEVGIPGGMALTVCMDAPGARIMRILGGPLDGWC